MRYQALILLIIISFFSSCKDNETNIPIDTSDKGPEGSELPYFVISSGANEIVDEPKVPGSIMVYENQQSTFSGNLGIELRGSTSRRLFPKKSFGFETWDENGADQNVSILDYPEEEDWILYGPYSDKTLFRNVLIFDLSNEIGQYAVRSDFIELNLNSVYRGVYVFLEKIKRDRNRVNILSLEPNQTDNEVIQGGYILKIDKTSGDSGDSDWGGDASYTPDLGFRSEYGAYGNQLTYPPFGDKRGEETYFLYEYPDRDRINEQQKDYIQNYIRDFEIALANEDYSGPREYENYIDVQSFVDFFLLNELSANPDAYRLSTFMHKDRFGKLKMGPIWDFNIAFGNDGRSRTNSWIYQYNEFSPDDLWLVHFWWPYLMRDAQFRAAIKSRWNELKGTVFNTSLIHNKIDEYVTYLNENGAIDRNYEKWPVIGEQLPFNSFVGNSYQEEVDYVKQWITDRMNWMDSEIQAW